MCKIAPTVPKTPLYLSLRPFHPLLYAHTHTHPFLWRCWNIIIDFAPKALNISFKKTNNIFTNHNIYKFLIGTPLCKIAPTFLNTPLPFQMPLPEFLQVYICIQKSNYEKKTFIYILTYKQNIIII